MFADAIRVIVGVLVLAGVLLFLGGMVSAWAEIRREKRAGQRVTRPGWNRADREALLGPSYAAPRGTWLPMFGLTAIGRPDLAERFLARRAARRGGAS